MKIVSIYSDVVPNLFNLLYSVEHKKKTVGYQHSSKYQLLCSVERRIQAGLEWHEGEYITISLTGGRSYPTF